MCAVYTQHMHINMHQSYILLIFSYLPDIVPGMMLQNNNTMLTSCEA